MTIRNIYLMMICTTVFWSGAFICGKLAIAEFSPVALTFFRFLFALPFIFSLLLKFQPQAVSLRREHWLPVLGLSILGTFGYHVFFFYSLRYTSPVNSALIGSTMPLVTTLFSVFLVGERLTWPRLAGMITALCGIMLVITKGNFSLLAGLQFNPGDAFMLAAVCCMALYTIGARHVITKRGVSPLTLTAYAFLFCTITALPFAWRELQPAVIARISMAAWLQLLYMAVFASVLGYWFQLIAVQHIGASRAASFVNLVPLHTIVLSSLLLGEPISILKLVSALFIIAGVYLASQPVLGSKLRLQKL